MLAAPGKSMQGLGRKQRGCGIEGDGQNREKMVVGRRADQVHKGGQFDGSCIHRILTPFTGLIRFHQSMQTSLAQVQVDFPVAREQMFLYSK